MPADPNPDPMLLQLLRAVALLEDQMAPADALAVSLNELGRERSLLISRVTSPGSPSPNTAGGLKSPTTIEESSGNVATLRPQSPSGGSDMRPPIHICGPPARVAHRSSPSMS